MATGARAAAVHKKTMAAMKRKGLTTKQCQAFATRAARRAK